MAINSNIAPYLSKLLSSATPLLSNILSGKDITSGNVGSIGGAAGSSLGSALGKAGTSSNILGSFFGGQGGSTLGNVLGGKDVSSSLYGNEALGSAFSNLGSILPGLLKNVNPATSYIGSTLGGLGGQAITGTGLFSNAMQAATQAGASTMFDVAGAGLKAAAPWGAIFSGQSDWTNPYSGYVESIGNILPGVGTVLGGFLEAAIGKDPKSPKDDPVFNMAWSSGTDRANQLAAQGMTPYEINKWANENGYVVYGGDWGGDKSKAGTITSILSPQEAITVDRGISSVLGGESLSPRYDSNKGYYWEQSSPLINYSDYGTAYRDPEKRKYFSTVDELLADTSFTKAMSKGSLDTYLMGAPKEVRQFVLQEFPEYGTAYYANPDDARTATETLQYQNTLRNKLVQDKQLPSYQVIADSWGGDPEIYRDYAGNTITRKKYDELMTAAGYAGHDPKNPIPLL